MIPDCEVVSQRQVWCFIQCKNSRVAGRECLFCSATQRGQPNRSQAYSPSRQGLLECQCGRNTNVPELNWAAPLGTCRCPRTDAGTVVEVVSTPSQPLSGRPGEDQSRPLKTWVRSWPCHWRLWMCQPPCLESQFPQSEFWKDRNAFPVSLKEFLRNEMNYERIFKIKQLRAGLSPEGKRGPPTRQVCTSIDL